jgi:cell division protein FtsW (lipid II flippase)
VCFSHALPLGRFFAFTAFMAMLPMRKMLAKHVRYGEWLFLAPLVGLIVSMSYGPYAMFAAMCGLYYVARRRLWLTYIVPALASVWILLVLSGAQPMYGVVNQIRAFNPERADSLQYRLDALDEYSIPIRQEPIFGWGGWNNQKTEMATDSAFLIMALSRGVISACLLFGWWFMAMHSCLATAKRYRDTPLADVLLGVALMIAVSIALSMVDNALDFHSMLLASGALGLEAALRRGVPAASGAPQAAPA